MGSMGFRGVNKFQKDLIGSMDQVGDDRAEQILMEYFCDQGAEIDWRYRTIPYDCDCKVSSHGICYKIEEKRRRQDWGDELLEDVSNHRGNTPGWTHRCSKFDYVLHAYPSGRHEIFPGPELEAAFKKHRSVWYDLAGGYSEAMNEGYITLNIPVPTLELRRAVAEEGAPICPYCGQNVGRFRMVCDGCGVVTCCAVGDAWLCEQCSTP